MTAGGDLDRIISIERASSEPNAFNEMVETWTVFLNRIRAKRRDVSDGEKLAGGQVGSSLSARFVVRSSIDARTITPKDRVLHDGATWSIHGVKEADEGRYRFIEITAVRDSDG